MKITTEPVGKDGVDDCHRLTKVSARKRSPAATRIIADHQCKAFILRADEDKVELSRLQALVATVDAPQPLLLEIQFIAHRLAGTGGVFGFAELSKSASILEDTILAENPGATPVEVADAIGRLNVAIERKQQ